MTNKISLAYSVRMRYRVLAQTPAGATYKPSDIRGWLTTYDANGDAWGARYIEDCPTLDEQVSLGWLEFFSSEAPPPERNQRIDMSAGRQLMLVCWVTQ